MTPNGSERFAAGRFLLVLSSISPLFVLWAFRGSGDFVPSERFLYFCLAMVFAPNAFLLFRLRWARRHRQQVDRTVGSSEDHRDQILVYLFAMLLPFYADSLSSARAMLGALGAVGFIVLLFWQLNLHYLNVFFALGGFKVFTVHPPVTDNRFAERRKWVLITRRDLLEDGTQLTVYRISDTVYWEA